MRALFDQLNRYAQDERGAAAIEYGLILSLLVLAIIAAVTSVGDATKGGFEKVTAGWGG